MDKIEKFGRNTKRFFRSFRKKEAEKNEILNFTTHIHAEQRIIDWHLENFNRCPLKTGEYHQSPFFCTGFSTSTKWALRIYPRGKTSAGKVGLFIHKMPSSTKLLMDCAFAIKIPDEETPYTVMEKQQIRMDSEEYGLEIQLPCPNLLGKKSVNVLCFLIAGYTDEDDDDVENCNAGSPVCTLSADLNEILSSSKFSDVTLQADKKQFRAHKAILSARSNVFAAMFDHPLEESQTSVVNIDDVEAPVLGDLLHYVYTGAVDNFTVEKAMALFSVADKYCLEDLQRRCVRAMLAKLCVENVCQVATLADMHCEQKLKTATNHVFRRYKHEIFDRKEWKTMIQERPLLATEILQGVTSDFHTSCSASFAADP